MAVANTKLRINQAKPSRALISLVKKLLRQGNLRVFLLPLILTQCSNKMTDLDFCPTVLLYEFAGSLARRGELGQSVRACAVGRAQKLVEEADGQRGATTGQQKVTRRILYNGNGLSACCSTGHGLGAYCKKGHGFKAHTVRTTWMVRHVLYCTVLQCKVTEL